MAGLHIRSELLIARLFDGKADVQVCGARFDAARGTVVLDIAGPTVPEAPEVIAIISSREREIVNVEFKPI